jgi:hypothetical protein
MENSPKIENLSKDFVLGGRAAGREKSTLEANVLSLPRARRG